MLAANDADVRKVDFILSDMNGSPVTLSRLHGKIVLVNFWATWCVPCLEEMHDLDAIYKQYGSRQMTVVSLTSDDRSTVQALLNREQYDQEILLDTGETVSKKFHVSEVPHLFIFDRTGEFVVDSVGQHTRPQILDMLHRKALLPEPK